MTEPTKYVLIRDGQEAIEKTIAYHLDNYETVGLIIYGDLAHIEAAIQAERLLVNAARESKT